MDKMIEKYIYSVTRRCPEAKRDDIKKELEANIMDMLQSYPNYTKDDIEEVLHKIGHPMDVAYQYHSSANHVVEPRFYEDYKLSLKLALIFSTILAVISAIIASLTELDVNQPGAIVGILIGHITSNVLSYGFSVFSIITIAFWSYKIPSIKEKIDTRLNNWKVKDLADVPRFEPDDRLKSRVKILIELIFVSIFMITFGTLFIVNYENIFVLHINGETSQFFNNDFKGVFTFFIISSTILTILSYLYRFYEGKESFYTLLFSTISEFYGSLFLVTILLLPNLILPQNFVMFADYFETSLLTITNIANIILYIIISIILLSSFISYFRRWIKYFKTRNIKR